MSERAGMSAPRVFCTFLTLSPLMKNIDELNMVRSELKFVENNISYTVSFEDGEEAFTISNGKAVKRASNTKIAQIYNYSEITSFSALFEQL